jgi:type I restriction enzyme R subunit
VLTYRNHKLAVIEAKRRDLPDTEGVGQAKKYAGKLQTRFAYSTNGVGIYQVDMTTGAEQYVAQYPTPDELWNRVFAEQNVWRDRFAAIPFEGKVATGRRAITRTSPSGACWRPLPRVRTASC